MCLRTCVDIAFTGNTAKTPEVLVFQVAAVTPAHNLHSDEVLLTWFDVLGDVELGGYLAVLAVAHILAVDIHGEVTGSRSDMDEDVIAIPVCWDSKRTAVGAHMVVAFLDERRIGMELVGPHITCVLVDRNAVSVHFPVTGDRHGAPTGVVVIHCEEIGWTVLSVFYPVELPGAFYRQESFGVLLLALLGELLCLVSEIISHIVKPVLFVQTRVKPLWCLSTDRQSRQG